MDIDDNNLGDAIDLLSRGFPHLSRTVWETGIARLKDSPGHREDEIPVGRLLYVDDRPVGVALSASSYRATPSSGKRRRIINLCSWYIEPDHRWRIPVLLRRMMKDKQATYTDLSPIPSVQRLLKTLGFEPINNGVDVAIVPILAMCRPDKARVVSLRDSGAEEFSPDCAQLIEDHLSYGCLAYSIELGDRQVPLLIKPLKRAALPLAQVIYCPDVDIMQRAMGSICRSMLRHGRLGLVLDIPIGAVPNTSLTRLALPARRRRFIKNGHQGGAIDYAYSELAFFDN